MKNTKLRILLGGTLLLSTALSLSAQASSTKMPPQRIAYTFQDDSDSDEPSQRPSVKPATATRTQPAALKRSPATKRSAITFVDDSDDADTPQGSPVKPPPVATSQRELTVLKQPPATKRSAITFVNDSDDADTPQGSPIKPPPAAAVDATNDWEQTHAKAVENFKRAIGYTTEGYHTDDMHSLDNLLAAYNGTGPDRAEKVLNAQRQFYRTRGEYLDETGQVSQIKPGTALSHQRAAASDWKQTHEKAIKDFRDAIWEKLGPNQDDRKPSLPFIQSLESANRLAEAYDAPPGSIMHRWIPRHQKDLLNTFGQYLDENGQVSTVHPTEAPEPLPALKPVAQRASTPASAALLNQGSNHGAGAAAAHHNDWGQTHAKAVEDLKATIRRAYPDPSYGQSMLRDDLAALDHLVEVYNRKPTPGSPDATQHEKDICQAQQALLSSIGVYLDEKGESSHKVKVPTAPIQQKVAHGAAAAHHNDWGQTHAKAVEDFKAAIRKTSAGPHQNMFGSSYLREDLGAVDNLVALYTEKNNSNIVTPELKEKIRQAKQTLLSGRGEYLNENGELSTVIPKA